MSQQPHVLHNPTGPRAAVSSSSFQMPAHLQADSQRGAGRSNTDHAHPSYAQSHPRSSSLPQQMGHGQSKPTPPLPTPQEQAQQQQLQQSSAVTKGLNAAVVAGGSKLRRAFAARRKKSEDAGSLSLKKAATTSVVEAMPGTPPSASNSQPVPHSQAKGMAWTPPPTSSSQILDKSPVASPSPVRTQFSQRSPAPMAPLAPPVPEQKGLPPSPAPPTLSALTVTTTSGAGNRNSVIPLSPGITSAVNYMMSEGSQQDQHRPQPTSGPVSGAASASTTTVSPIPSAVSTGGDMKETWRKSDSTNSHHTVRGNSNRTSRPVSWAESFQSAHTVVQGSGQGGKRASALIQDADFGVAEEDSEEEEDDDEETSGGQTLQAPTPVPLSRKISPSSLDKNRNRRSLSLGSALPSSMANFLGGGGAKQQKQYAGEPPPYTPTIHSYPRAPSMTSSISQPQPSSASVSSSSISSHSPTHTHSASTSQLHIQGHPHPHSHSHSQSQAFSNSTTPTSASHPPSAAANLKGKLAAWGASTSNALSTGNGVLARNEQRLPPIPGSTSEQGHGYHPRSSPSPTPTSSSFMGGSYGHGAHPSSSSSGSSSQVNLQARDQALRQPAVSGIGNAASGLAKRAVEKMGKKWGGMMGGMMNQTSSSGSGYSSAASGMSASMTSAGTSMSGSGGSVTAPWGEPPSSADSGHRHHHHHKQEKHGGHKRTPGANKSSGTGESITSSVGSSSTSASDTDPFGVPSGPVFGRRLRSGKMGGMVFKRDLRSVVRDTRCVLEDESGGRGAEADVGEPRKVKEGLVKALEERMLPALVVRCAQHVLVWGVQEEGLFRVPGRPRHVNELRAEFDSGADYDMTECSPGDLDPHAVASVFKAFLRELPEPILTHKLQPYFDAAINKETSLNSSEQAHHPALTIKPGKGLPSGPRSGFNNSANALRKPPSLSTLAMPTFNAPPPSKSLIAAIRSVISQLPRENRDLLMTVVDLIKATAKESKETKMPLSNLMLVFCPSLSMNPPLLKVLCEAEGIWAGEEVQGKTEAKEEEEEEEEDIIDIRRRTVVQAKEQEQVVDEEAPPTPPKDDVVVDDEVASSASNAEDDAAEEESLRSGRASLDHPSSLDYHGSAEEDSSFYDKRPVAPRRRKDDADRREVPTVYLDTRSHLSSSSASSLAEAPETSRYDGSFVPPTRPSGYRQDSRDDQVSISSLPYSHSNVPQSPSPPPLSSSADSISTPTSSANPSFSHLPLDGNDKDSERKDSDVSTKTASASVPQIVETAPLELRKRPLISNPIPMTGPVQFPTASPQPREGFVPATPQKRRSIPLLSLSNFTGSSGGDKSPQGREMPMSGSPSSGNTSSPGYGSEKEVRSKKPSLKLLFSKKSSSSLSGEKEREKDGGGKSFMGFLNPPVPQFHQDRQSPSSASASDSSVSTPLSAVTAPQTSTSSSSYGSMKDLPPVLDTPIEGSSLSFDFEGVGDAQTPSTATVLTGVPMTEEPPSYVPTKTPISASTAAAPGPSNMLMNLVLPTVQPLSFTLRKKSAEGQRQESASASSRRLRSQPSTASLLGEHEPLEREDWTKSVLMAADVVVSPLPPGYKA